MSKRTEPADISTNSRDEMICPHCWTRGLVESQGYIRQFEGDNDSKKSIIYATACRNPECIHSEQGSDDPARIPPGEIKKQYSSIPLSNLGFGVIAENLGAISVAVVVVIIGVLLITSGLPSFGGNGASNTEGVAEAAPNEYENLTETDGGFSVLRTEGNWTIYRNQDNTSYLVSGELNGKLVYLYPNGDYSKEPYIFDTVQAAEDAIFAWRTKNQQQPEKYPEPNQTSTSLVAESAWQIYQHNGKYFVAAEINGNVVFLHPNGYIGNEPYLYDSRGEARDAILAYHNQYGNYSPDGERISEVGMTDLQRRLVDIDPDGDLTDDDHNFNQVNGGSTVGSVISEDSDSSDPLDDSTSNEQRTGESDGYNSDTSGDEYKIGTGDSTSGSDGGGDTTTGGAGGSGSDTGSSGSGTEPTDDESGDDIGDSQVVRGQVTDSSGDPVEGATVHMYSEHKTAVTGEDGRYIFRSVPTGQHDLFVTPPEGSELVGTANTTIEMHDDGRVEIVEAGKTAKYFKEGSAVAGNKIAFQTHQGRPITATGSGTRVAAPVVFRNPANADGVTVKLEGIYTQGMEQTTFRGADTVETLNIGGQTTPKTQEIAVSGYAATNRVTESGTIPESGRRLDLDGNARPSDISVQLQPNYSVKEKTYPECARSADSIWESSGCDSRRLDTRIPIKNKGSLPPGNMTLTVDTQQGFRGNYSGTAEATVTVESWTARNKKSGSTTIYTASSTREWKIRASWSYDAEAYIDIPSCMGVGCDDPSYHEYTEPYEINAKLIIVRDNGSTETIKRVEKAANAGSTEGGGGTTETVTLHPGDKVKSVVNINGDEVTAKMKGKIYKKLPPEPLVIRTGNEVFRTQRVGDGDTIRITGEELNVSSNTEALTIDTDHLTGTYELQYEQRNGTLNPEVTAGGKVFCRIDGGLDSNLNCDIPPSAAKQAGNTIRIASDQGAVPYELAYTERNYPQSAEVVINGQEYEYPQDFNGNGLLKSRGQPITTDVLEAGKNRIQIESTPINGERPEVGLSIRHSTEPRQTTRPIIKVISPNGEIRQKKLPEKYLVNGQLTGEATVKLPADWFSRGRNIVVVSTPDKSQVQVTFQADGLQTQTQQFVPPSRVDVPNPQARNALARATGKPLTNTTSERRRGA